MKTQMKQETMERTEPMQASEQHGEEAARRAWQAPRLESRGSVAALTADQPLDFGGLAMSA